MAASKRMAALALMVVLLGCTQLGATAGEQGTKEGCHMVHVKSQGGNRQVYKKMCDPVYVTQPLLSMAEGEQALKHSW
jgi:hypothetical protein